MYGLTQTSKPLRSTATSPSLDLLPSFYLKPLRILNVYLMRDDGCIESWIFECSNLFKSGSMIMTWRTKCMTVNQLPQNCLSPKYCILTLKLLYTGIVHLPIHHPLYRCYRIIAWYTTYFYPAPVTAIILQKVVVLMSVPFSLASVVHHPCLYLRHNERFQFSDIGTESLSWCPMINPSHDYKVATLCFFQAWTV